MPEIELEPEEYRDIAFDKARAASRTIFWLAVCAAGSFYLAVLLYGDGAEKHLWLAGLAVSSMVAGKYLSDWTRPAPGRAVQPIFSPGGLTVIAAIVGLILAAHLISQAPIFR
jgi:hypothetical protein